MAVGPWRIRDRSTFQELRRTGVRARRGPVTVTFSPDAGTRPRFAFGVGRAFGPAVARNRVKRILRDEAARAELPAGAYLISVSPSGASATPAELRTAFTAAAAAATERARR